MCNRREAVQKAMALLTAFSVGARGQGKTSVRGSQALTIPFEYAAGRRSLLVRARVNRHATLLIIDTGSVHTILCPSLAGIDLSQGPARPNTKAGVIGDAIGRVVTLELGSRVWQERRVSVMDLSQPLSAYQEKIGGLLGLDFLMEFSQVSINLKEAMVSFIH
jgi:hypothetical protein